jgi:hypothetical protein
MRGFRRAGFLMSAQFKGQIHVAVQLVAPLPKKGVDQLLRA